jgi:hypothetical protein
VTAEGLYLRPCEGKVALVGVKGGSRRCLFVARRGACLDHQEAHCAVADSACLRCPTASRRVSLSSYRNMSLVGVSRGERNGARAMTPLCRACRSNQNRVTLV